MMIYVYSAICLCLVLYIVRLVKYSLIMSKLHNVDFIWFALGKIIEDLTGR